MESEKPVTQSELSREKINKLEQLLQNGKIIDRIRELCNNSVGPRARVALVSEDGGEMLAFIGISADSRSGEKYFIESSNNGSYYRVGMFTHPMSIVDSARMSTEEFEGVTSERKDSPDATAVGVSGNWADNTWLSEDEGKLYFNVMNKSTGTGDEDNIDRYSVIPLLPI